MYRCIPLAMVMAMVCALSNTNAQDDAKKTKTDDKVVKLAGTDYKVTKTGLKAEFGELNIDGSTFKTDSDDNTVTFKAGKATECYWKNVALRATINDKAISSFQMTQDRQGYTHLPELSEDDEVALKLLTAAEARVFSVKDALAGSGNIYWGYIRICGMSAKDCEQADVKIDGKTLTVTVTLSEKCVVVTDLGNKTGGGEVIIEVDEGKKTTLEPKFGVEQKTVIPARREVTFKVTSIGNP
ncbi:MAG: hypothetical protein EB060_02730 [Proteobacteria bacterium]|nr:hypothetical protein [Pseudomonadota bacterium]